MLTVGQFIEQTKRPTWTLSSNNTVRQALQKTKNEKMKEVQSHSREEKEKEQGVQGA